MRDRRLADLALVEWPERAGALLPLPDLRLRIAVEPDDSRNVVVEAFTATGSALLQAACDAAVADR